MKTIFLYRMFMNIPAAVREGDIYYVSVEEVEKLKNLLTVFSILAIVGAVLVAAIVVLCVVKSHKANNKRKGGEEIR